LTSGKSGWIGDLLQLPVQFRHLWRTLRFRLAAWNALVVGVIALVMLVGVRQGVRWAVFHEVDQMLLEEAREISLSLGDAGANEFTMVEEELSRKSVGHQHHGWFAELFNAQGQAIWSSHEAPFPPVSPVSARSLVPYSVGQLRIIEMHVPSRAFGITDIRVGARLDSIYRDIAHLDRLMFIAAATLVLIAPLCGYWLAGRAARTVGDIIHTAARLRPSHLDERLKLQGTEDELDQLAQTINGLLDRIAVYLQAKRDFLANAAHELRTPLAAIRSSIEVALNRDQTNLEYEVVLEDLIDQSIALETLVNQLLLLSETEAETDHSSQQFECVQFHEVVSRAVDMFLGVAESRDIELTLEKVDQVVVAGNRQHLRQVVNNLVDNAIKYTPQGGRIHVNLEHLEAEKIAKLTIQDTGIGIAPDDLPHIFERFFRADRSRSRSLAIHGTGLGLSICQAVVNAHGGRIVCHSIAQQGTTMEISLPLTKEVEEIHPGSPVVDVKSSSVRIGQ